MKTFLETWGLALLAVFAPIKPMMLATGALIVADLITGVWSAVKRKEKITSAKLKQTVVKLFLYEIALALAFIVHQYLVGDLLPAEKIVATLIGLTELKSLLENLDAIQGEPFFASIIKKVMQVKETEGKSE